MNKETKQFVDDEIRFLEAFRLQFDTKVKEFSTYISEEAQLDLLVAGVRALQTNGPATLSIKDRIKFLKSIT